MSLLDGLIIISTYFILVLTYHLIRVHFIRVFGIIIKEGRENAKKAGIVSVKKLNDDCKNSENEDKRKAKIQKYKSYGLLFSEENQTENFKEPTCMAEIEIDALVKSLNIIVKVEDESENMMVKFFRLKVHESFEYKNQMSLIRVKQLKKSGFLYTPQSLISNVKESISKAVELSGKDMIFWETFSIDDSDTMFILWS